MVHTTSTKELKTKMDAKAKPHLEQYAPVWIIDEKVLLEEEAIQFNVVFLHPRANLDESPSWVNRRYRYDAFNNTLYHKGQTLLDEEAVVEIQAKEPYINAVSSDIPNSYGG
jgi:predicted SPOUT superfamily RNA methylase MTH1